MRGTLRYFMLALGFTGLGVFLGAYFALAFSTVQMQKAWDRELRERFGRESSEAKLIACEFWRKK
jgi:hypothetical protein